MDISTSPFSLAGKVCVIAGGTGLIGSECARMCATQGATVVIISRNQVKAEAVAATIGTNAFVEIGDITDPEQALRLVEDIEQKYGKIDGLVIATHFGTGVPGTSPLEVSYDDFSSYLLKSIGGPFLLARACAKKMILQRSGSIVFFGSIYGVAAPNFELFKDTAMTVRAEYAIAKAGLLQLMRYVAKDWATYNIRANAISPGALIRNQSEKFVKAYGATVPLGNRLVEANDIAPMVAYLLSDASAHITGQNIVIDGGWTL